MKMIAKVSKNGTVEYVEAPPEHPIYQRRAVTITCDKDRVISNGVDSVQVTLNWIDGDGLTAEENLDVEITVNTTKFTKSITNGQCTFNLSFATPGQYNISTDKGGRYTIDAYSVAIDNGDSIVIS